MSTGEDTPRVGPSGSQRGVPQTAVGSGFGSPPQQRGGSLRPRNSRFNTTAGSRSASRARPPLPTNNSSGGIAKLAAADDEDEEEDRGAALIRQRQKERKQLRKAKEKGRKLAEGDVTDSSAPPTSWNGEGFGAQQGRRSASRARTPSAGVELRREGYFGTMSQTDGRSSPYDELRPPSIYSSTADEDDETAQDNASVVNEVVQEIVEQAAEEEGSDQDGDGSGEGDEGVTLKDRQDALNIEHPFGLPIWKPALYRKSRTVTRNAESALHSIPSAAAERHLLPGNLLWTVMFGWWMAIACFFVAVLVSGAEVLGGGRGGYGKTLRGLAWYIGWPFGKYVEGEGGPDDSSSESSGYGTAKPSSQRHPSSGSAVTIRDNRPQDEEAPDTAATVKPASTSVSFAPVKPTNRDALRDLDQEAMDERAPLLLRDPTYPAFRRPRNSRAKFLGRLIYWPGFFLIVAPVMLTVCLICWGLVITIPMAKLNWALLKLLYSRPLEINFNSAPKIPVSDPEDSSDPGNESGSTTMAGSGSGSSPDGRAYKFKAARLTAGQSAPTPGYQSTVLLCTYRAVGLQYYKYTVGGVNIMFINLLPLVFFTIFDAFVLLPAAQRSEHRGHTPDPFFAFITSQALIFVLSLASVIPLSYFIGMAVASISAQSSIGMGAVINATFGSIIEIILYGIALTQGKGRLVEGSIIGSILAGVLLMPGASMCSGALKKKEQKFNAKSAGVTSTMLIMAIIGTLTPTMFYQTYGSFELHCSGCPAKHGQIHAEEAWKCTSCVYEHPDPASDPFYQDQVKTLMYMCAGILLFSYLIGLWFSLRTHAAQIYQNPQQLMKAEESAALHPAIRSTLNQRVSPQALMQHILPLHKGANSLNASQLNSPILSTSQQPTLRLGKSNHPAIGGTPQSQRVKSAPLSAERMPMHDDSQPQSRLASGAYNLPQGYSPFLDTVDRDMKQHHLAPMSLPSTLTTEDFTRAVAVATVSALRHQGSIINGHSRRERSTQGPAHNEEEEHGGHEAPSWTRGVSAGVLLGCTLLYAIIAEILVDVVDVVLHGSGIDEKFLGLTLFALVPNTTEFMNAMSFAINGNIALSMEIGSAYALQVCLLQIPAMVAFSAFYDPAKLGDVVDTFTLIFPRWDVIAIILSIFLLTYTYIEARSNYHRGSILVLAYVVLIMGFYYAPLRSQGDVDVDPDVVFGHEAQVTTNLSTRFSALWI
ncbi:hypothetical protein BD324DRAFT_632740 [Kockovaella imperatae]|uniref:Sodium/calcium exchanger protein-domain-containing protein n=1 Tax=Kockovaella imperatae TaxID=4999 RepID=A0A1Y1UBN9_9TREE|nr:hypothetical protein BD324DRAFT_632740 [Kockovaella imperatae]ORX35412.1 hypothetical protein BD324DRAFT_632740 [Kockovaella imperatae]